MPASQVGKANESPIHALLHYCLLHFSATCFFLNLILTSLFRHQGQGGQSSVHQECYSVPPHPLAPLRPPSLLLRDDGEGAEEVACCAAGLCETQ